MSFVIRPIPKPEDVPELTVLLDHREDEEFVSLLLKSLQQADRLARDGGLDPAIYEALPLDGMDGWPTTFDAYIDYLVLYSRWVPHQSENSAWVNPTSPVAGDHREVYDYLCWFYWLIDQNLEGVGKIVENVPWFAQFLVDWANVWGRFLDSTESFSPDILATWRKESPRYRIEDSMIPDESNPGELRSNAPSGWLTFNQFFARELNSGLRPVADPGANTTVTSPADCTYKMHYAIDENSNISPPIVIKGTHTYANVGELLHNSAYAESFAGGSFLHCFLGPYSYHRFHTPVAGVVKECYPLTGQVYLQVSLADQQFEAADSADDGYEFQQARGVLTIDTAGSPCGDIGIVAVIPIGMCQVSGVNMTHEVGAECAKGDEFGYFTFGGSDIIVLTQKGTDPVYNPAFVEGTDYYSLYGTSIATVTPLSD